MSKHRVLMVAAAAFAMLAKRGKEMLRTRTCRTASLVMVFTAILGLALSASAGDHPVPFRGRADAVITSAEPAPDGLHVTTAGEGRATHLGRFTSAEQAVIHADGTIQATVVLTAVNGDQLFYSEVAKFTSPTTVASTITITGGTGRFENASGTAHEEAIVAPDGLHFSFTFEGTIRF